MLDTTPWRSTLSFLPVNGQEYVLDVESTDPARKVGERRKRNVILEVAMSRLGVVLQAESLSGEFMFLNGLEARNDVLAAFDQPISIELLITTTAGHSSTIWYTPDYLVIFRESVCVYEIKADHELENLCKIRPLDWQQTEFGYRFLPAERALAKLGIKLVVIPTSQLSPILAANQRLLACVRELEDTKRLTTLRKKFLGIVHHEESIRIGDALDRLEENDATAILQLIEKQLIFADLEGALLSDPREIWIATSPELAKAAASADRFLSTALVEADSDSEYMPGNPRYYGELARRFSLLHCTHNATEAPPKKKPGLGRRGSRPRTLRNYRKLLRDAGGNPQALDPNWAKCGNREIRISPTHRAFALSIIRMQRADPNDTSVKAAFDTYKNAFKAFKEETELYHVRRLSRRYFYKLSNEAPGRSDDAAKKGGRRLENASRDAFDPRDKTFVATRPFEVAHIDHYLTDIFVVIGRRNGKKLTRRAWLTAMVDACTKEVLAIWLGFASPSKKSCSMVIRDCVRRHGRVPEIIVVDSGSDFRSDHFAVMLAGLRVTRAERPVEDPRFGKEVERLFGILKEKCLRGLPGYGLSIQQSRAISAAFKAQENASLSLVDLTRIICAFVFEGYNILGANSPKDLRATFQATLGSLGGRRAAWDMRLLILTAIEAPSADYKLWKGQGIRVFDRWYTSSELQDFYGYKNQISVKIEPFNDSYIYVFIDGKWLTAFSADKRYRDALSEAKILAQTSISQDLRSYLAELATIADQEIAAIVEKNLSASTESSSAANSEPETNTSKPSDPQPKSKPRARFSLKGLTATPLE